MRIFIIAFAVIAATSAASISSDYLPPVVDNSLAPSKEYLAPAPSNEYLAPAPIELETSPSDDGYRYKTVRKLRLRHRRDVSEILNKEYLPPNEDSSAASVEVSEVVAVEVPSQELSAASVQTSAVLAVEAPEEQTVLADDGYRYKVVRRIRYRHRRDVNELPANEYLSPNQESSAASEDAVVVVIDAPVEALQQEESEAVAVVAPEEKTVLADDGYRYKVVRRIRYRQRRDVNELPANEYLPPNQESSPASEEAVSIVVDAPVEAPQVEASEALVVVTPEEKNILADDGYRYKVVRRIRYRHRRDVNELAANEYLPPNQDLSAASEEAVAVEAPVQTTQVATLLASAVQPVQELASEVVVVEAPEEKTVLADDGYRYKVVRRIRYRHRRDVNELPANEYLPPNQELSAASEEAVAVQAPVEAAIVLAAPVQTAQVATLLASPVQPVQELASEVVVVEAPEEKTVLADDGYRYKVVRRIRYRHRRDVNELPVNEYLPPNQELSAASEEAVAVDAPVVAAPVVVTTLLSSPVQPVQELASEVLVVEAPEEKTVLADDGYRYKVVRRIRYRHRRDVNELPVNEYLPPNQKLSAASEEAGAVQAPVEATIALAAPVQTDQVATLLASPVQPVQKLASEVLVVEAPEEKTVLADDGYRYKVVRRIRYRHRRDVNELPVNEYLPPNQELSAASEEAVAVQAPVEATIALAAPVQTDQVATLLASPVQPVQKLASEVLVVEAPEEKTVLADDGYRYKVVRRIRYRHRRDVNELQANEYLPPNQDLSAASEEAVAVEAPVVAATVVAAPVVAAPLLAAPVVPAQVEASEAVVVVEAPEEKTVLADDGYRYKVVRRIRYRRH